MMRFSFYDVLRQWYPLRHQHRWVLGAVVETHGSVYRKAGAMMLLSDAGHQLGLLSGGCLESDLLIQARKVSALKKSLAVSYDGSDEDNIAWRLGIGCGGRADIVLHNCHTNNDFLHLEALYHHVCSGKAAIYSLHLEAPSSSFSHCAKRFDRHVDGSHTPGILTCVINPPPQLLICGGGIDIVSIAQLAEQVGWQVSVLAQHIKHELRQCFSQGTRFFTDFSEAGDHIDSIDVAIVANHNVERDALHLGLLQDSSVSYLGLLGPKARKAKVLEQAGLDARKTHIPVAGPMGLALGGDLPENIALSVISEAHAVLYGSDARALSDSYWCD